IEHPNHYRLMFMTPLPRRSREEQLLEHGNPDEDAYAFVRGLVVAALEAGRFRPELKGPDLIAQILWAGTHGIASLEIAKAQDDWVDWRSVKKRTKLMVEVLLRGLLKEGR